MFQPMDPDLVRSLIEGQPDVLSDEVKRDEELYKNAQCPMCYERGMQKVLLPSQVLPTEAGPEVISSPFTEGQILPQGYAHCDHCSTDFDPYTGIIRQSEASMIASPLSDPLPE